MQPIHSFSAGLLAEIIRRQPASKGKTTFAWQLVVGPALARVTSVELVDRTLQVRAVDSRWVAEIARATPIIVERLQQLLGSANVRRLTIVSDDH